MLRGLQKPAGIVTKGLSHAPCRGKDLSIFPPAPLSQGMRAAQGGVGISPALPALPARGQSGRGDAGVAVGSLLSA